MRRRRFLYTGLAAGLTVGLAGCSNNPDQGTPTDNSSPTESQPSTDTSTPPNTDESTETDDDQQTEADPENAVRYFFEDETGALGHLADDEAPGNHDHIITNSTTEAEYQEMQRNDRKFAEGRKQGQLSMTVDEMITRAEEIYNNPEANFDTERAETLGVNLLQEDDEITFTRALVKATQEAGVDSSGLADIVVANIAEDAVDQIQPGFTDYKLSTLPATEAIGPEYQGHAGGVRETEDGLDYGNSGFRHMAALLQYQKNGETEVKYAEQTDGIDVTPIFSHAIRDPEESIYRSSLGEETVNTTGGGYGIRFPEHYVTAFDYTKARELEASDENILGLGENNNGEMVSVGSRIGGALFQLVDDMGITGYDVNEDRDLPQARTSVTSPLVSDEFGESLEDHITEPNTEKRGHLENIARGMYQIQEQEGWGSHLALTGTLNEPEILPTDQDTVNQVRQDRAYDEVRERVTG